MAKGDTKTNQYLDIAANGTRSDFPASCCETRSQTLIREVGERIMDLEDEVERLENNPDVVDIVATYADLQSYDTSQLTDKDVIRVLQDETHDGDSTYYRWSTSTNTWTYIGESKQYTDFVGTDGTTAGEAGLVPAPVATEAGYFLSASGTWEEVGGGSITPVQTTGTSTTDVMSQNATSQMIYPSGYETSKNRIAIGANATSGSDGSITIGVNASGGNRSTSDVVIGWAAHAFNGNQNVVIGANAKTTSNSSGAISVGAYANSENNTVAPHSIALGDYSKTTQKGQMDISTMASTNTYGYNDSQYRLLTGLYDGQSAHDAVNLGQITPTTDSSAPSTSTVGRLGEVRIDTTDNSAYMCVVSDSVTPAYEWKKITA